MEKQDNKNIGPYDEFRIYQNGEKFSSDGHIYSVQWGEPGIPVAGGTIFFFEEGSGKVIIKHATTREAIVSNAWANVLTTCLIFIPGGKMPPGAVMAEKTATTFAGRAVARAAIVVENVNSKLAKQLREAVGKGHNVTVKTQKEAEALIEKARPQIRWRNTYEAPKPKIGKEIHPPDGSGTELPHIKWRDWTGGKSKGAEGRIYFEGL